MWFPILPCHKMAKWRDHIKAYYSDDDNDFVGFVSERWIWRCWVCLAGPQFSHVSRRLLQIRIWGVDVQARAVLHSIFLNGALLFCSCALPCFPQGTVEMGSCCIGWRDNIKKKQCGSTLLRSPHLSQKLPLISWFTINLFEYINRVWL